MPFLHTPQGFTNRIDLNTSPSSIEGIFTGGFTTCVIVIIASRQSGRMSLTHADSLVPQAAIQREIDWVEKNGQFRAEKTALVPIYDSIDDSALNDVMPDLAPQFRLKPFTRDIIDSIILGVSINRSFQLKGYYQMQADVIPALTHREGQQLATALRYLNFISTTIAFEGRSADYIPQTSLVIYDGSAMQPLQDCERQFNELARRRMMHFSTITGRSTEVEWRNAHTRMWFAETEHCPDLKTKPMSSQIEFMKSSLDIYKIYIANLLRATNGNMNALLAPTPQSTQRPTR